jgi:hypothetical protein
LPGYGFSRPAATSKNFENKSFRGLRYKNNLEYGDGMEPMLTTASAVIDRLGGNQKVAALTRRNAAAVSNWRRFNAFPADTYLVLSRSLKDIGESAPPSLWKMVNV